MEKDERAEDKLANAYEGADQPYNFTNIHDNKINSNNFQVQSSRLGECLANAPKAIKVPTSGLSA
jgi:hypothetical protein